VLKAPVHPPNCKPHVVGNCPNLSAYLPCPLPTPSTTASTSVTTNTAMSATSICANPAPLATTLALHLHLPTHSPKTRPYYPPKRAVCKPRVVRRRPQPPVLVANSTKLT
jgi:hypothetical protein